MKITSNQQTSSDLDFHNATIYTKNEDLKNLVSESDKNASLDSNSNIFLKKGLKKTSNIENNSIIENNDKTNVSKVKHDYKKNQFYHEDIAKSTILNKNISALQKRKSNFTSLRRNLNLKKSENLATQSLNKTEKSETYYYDYEEEEYDEAYNLSRYHNFIFKNKCNQNRCAAPRGQCLKGENEKVCRCSPGYLNYRYPNGEVLVCGYKQKSQFIAFVLELSLLFGGNIYLGFYVYAYIKGIVYLTIFLFAYLKIPCRLCGVDNLIKSKCDLCPWVEYTTIIIIIFGVFCWQTVDLVKIITTNNKDAFNMPILDYF